MKLIFAALLAVSIGYAQQEPIAVKTHAPELLQGPWLNSSSPISLALRKGKVTIVHFWTFGCINCKHNLGAYNNWNQQFHGRGVEVIGIHTPESDAEKTPSNVAKAVKQYGIEYPVLIDNDYANWKRWNQQFWPVVYLVDKKGNIRYRWEGELNYRNSGGGRRMTELIEQLLAENE